MTIHYTTLVTTLVVVIYSLLCWRWVKQYREDQENLTPLVKVAILGVVLVWMYLFTPITPTYQKQVSFTEEFKVEEMQQTERETYRKEMEQRLKNGVKAEDILKENDNENQ